MPTVFRLNRLPENFGRYIDEVAEGMEAVYGPAAAREYQDSARTRVRATMSHPDVITLGSGSSDHPSALLMAIVHDAVGQIFFLHALQHATSGVLDTLIKEVIRSLRSGGVDGILCESIVIHPVGPMDAFEEHHFQHFKRSVMRAQLQDLALARDNPAIPIVELEPASVPEIGACLAAAYADDPGADLHREMRDPESAASFTQSVMAGGFGHFEAGYALGIRDGDHLGAVLLGCEPVAKAGFVVQVATRPESRGRGMAQLLLDAIAYRFRTNGLEHITLGVTDTNPAVRLYERFGMQRVWPVHAYSWWRP